MFCFDSKQCFAIMCSVSPKGEEIFIFFKNPRIDLPFLCKIWDTQEVISENCDFQWFRFSSANRSPNLSRYYAGPFQLHFGELSACCSALQTKIRCNPKLPSSNEISGDMQDTWMVIPLCRSKFDWCAKFSLFTALYVKLRMQWCSKRHQYENVPHDFASR